jgi:L-2,4-diaminobutyrate decarboxylase
VSNADHPPVADRPSVGPGAVVEDQALVGDRPLEDWFLSGRRGSERLFRELVDLSSGMLLSAAARPASMPVSTGEIRGHVLGDADPFPEVGVGGEAAWRGLAQRVLDHSVNVSSTGYMAHYLAPPLIPSIVADLVIGAMNQSLDSFDQGPSATVVETAMIELCCGELGLAGGDGVFTPGASTSNLMGIHLARQHLGSSYPGSGSVDGRGADAGRAVRVVCSAQAHFSVTMACSLLGLGEDAVVPVATGRDGAMCPDALEAAVAGVVADGHPAALVVTLGTTDRGAIDPLPQAAELAARHGLWLHADAAATGPLAFSRRHRHLLGEVAVCDSIAFDFHKLGWLTVPCGLFLVRDRTQLERLRHHADYLNPEDEPDDQNLAWKSTQTTRRFDALKLALVLASLGRDGFEALIDAQQGAVARAGRRLRQEAELEVVSDGGLHTIVFRYVGVPRLTDARLGPLNIALRSELSRRGVAILGRGTDSVGPVLKLQILNPLMTEVHTDRLLAALLATGRELAGAGRADHQRTVQRIDSGDSGR